MNPSNSKLQRPAGTQILGVLLLLGACSREEAPQGGIKDPTASDFVGYCAPCHGRDGEGNAWDLGPALVGLGVHWDQASLLEYLEDPDTYSQQVSRLGFRRKPAMDPVLSPARRRAVVAYALSLMRGGETRPLEGSDPPIAPQ